MRDLIDLANLVYDQLIKEHGETKEGRLLFLYGASMGNEWFIAGSNKFLTVSIEGVTKNFKDEVIDGLSTKWKELVATYERKKLDAMLKKMRSEYEFTVKPGDMYEFGKSSSEFREIGFNPLRF